MVSDKHPSNAFEPIELIVLGNTRSYTPVPLNAFLPIDVGLELSPNVTDVKEIHPENSLSFIIEVNPSENIMLCIVLLSVNLPLKSTFPDGVMMFVLELGQINNLRVLLLDFSNNSPSTLSYFVQPGCKFIDSSELQPLKVPIAMADSPDGRLIFFNELQLAKALAPIVNAEFRLVNVTESKELQYANGSPIRLRVVPLNVTDFRE